jgi:hypothetical protein
MADSAVRLVMGTGIDDLPFACPCAGLGVQMTVFSSTVRMIDSTMETTIDARHPMREILIVGPFS